MDIILNTNSEDEKLEFRNCEKFEDGSGYKVDLYVKSGTFAAGLDFYFEEFPLQKFIDDLSHMAASLTGEALLKPMWEDGYVEMKVVELGHVSVEGEFSLLRSEYRQKLAFGFETDQTALQPFIEQLKRLSFSHQ